MEGFATKMASPMLAATAAKARRLWEHFGKASSFLARHEPPQPCRFWQATKAFLRRKAVAVLHENELRPAQQSYQANTTRCQ